MSIEIYPAARPRHIAVPTFEDCDPANITPELRGAYWGAHCGLDNFNKFLSGNVPDWEAAIAKQAEARFLGSLVKLGIVDEAIAEQAQNYEQAAVLAVFTGRIASADSFELWREPIPGLDVAVYLAEKCIVN